VNKDSYIRNRRWAVDWRPYFRSRMVPGLVFHCESEKGTDTIEHKAMCPLETKGEIPYCGVFSVISVHRGGVGFRNRIYAHAFGKKNYTHFISGKRVYVRELSSK
jgi:hypothetical protein